MNKNIVICFVLMFGSVSVFSADFVDKPLFEKNGSAWTISFTLDAATDVTVDVLAKNGTVIRRIGSGLLGANAPLPFAKNSLSQTISWDGLDENGATVSADAAPVLRVRLGLHTEFDKFVGKQSIPAFQNYSMAGMAVGPDRNLYVVASISKRPSAHLAVYSPAGTYVKTLIPFPADYDPTGIDDFKIISRENGNINPMLHHRLTHSQVPGFVAMDYMTMDVNSAGKMVMVSGSSYKEYEKECNIVMVNCDGTIPRKSIVALQQV